MRSACTVSNTSWTRTTCAPCSAACSANAMLPPRPLVGGCFARQRADRALAARADDDRAAERVEQRTGRSSAQGCGATFLPKPKPGSIRICRPVDSRTRHRLDPLFQPEINLDQHVVVARVVLHRLGRALVMHQHDRTRRAAATTPAARSSYVSADTSLIIRAPASSAAVMTSALRVSAETAAPPIGEPPDHGANPLDLVPLPHRLRAGTRRLAADIDDCGARTQPCPCLSPAGSANRPPSEKLSGVDVDDRPSPAAGRARIVRSPR